MRPERIDNTDFFPAFRHIETFIQSAAAEGKPILVAIEGPCGSGKSTLASHLADAFGEDTNVFHMDHFFLPEIRKTPERLGEPGGNVDHERFRAEVADGLRGGGPFKYRVFDCALQQLAETVQVSPRALTIIEGVYSMHPLVSLDYDCKIFLSLSRAEQLRRILARSGPDMLERFVREWIPMENRYFEAMGIREQCSLVLGENYE
jgi:uridine kinase